MLNQRSWLCVVRGVCVAALLSLSGTTSLSAQENSVDGEASPPVASTPAEQIAPAWQPESAEQSVSVDQAAETAVPASKVVYKSIDSTGKVTFTDVPPADWPSEPIKVHAANTMPVGRSSASEENSDKKQGPVKYTLLAITSPVNDEVYGQDVESVTLAAQLEPGLQDGHTFQLYFDGKPVGTNEMSYTVSPLERGTHTVEAKVFDSKKKLLKSAEKVQFHVRRISAINKVSAATLPARNNNPPGTQPGDLTGGFGSPKGAGGLGGSGTASGAGSAGGAASPGDAVSSRGAASRVKSK